MNDRVDVGKFATAGMVSRNVVTQGGICNDLLYIYVRSLDIFEYLLAILHMSFDQILSA